MSSINPKITLEEIQNKLTNTQVNEWKTRMDDYETFLSEQMNIVSLPYRTALIQISNIREAQHDEMVRTCKHDFERFCEYHNDVYHICRKCGYEK